jgi:sugar/nucleoside kinase (ribokinase family)
MSDKSRNKRTEIVKWKLLIDRYSFDDIAKILDLITVKSVLVIGETIIDEYAYVEPMSKSPKGALLTSHYIKSRYFAGGILACANHIAGFCGRIRLATCLGQKKSRLGFVKKNLLSNIDSIFFYRQGANTTLNTRFTINGTNNRIFGVYHFDHSPLNETLQATVLSFLEAEIYDYDLVLAVDYGHGFFTEKIIAFLADKSKFLALNVQTNSTNFGFNPIHKFPKADYICLDEIESRLAAGNRFGRIEDIVSLIAEKMSCPRISVTLGQRGVLIYDRGAIINVPAFPVDVVDTVGTGDAYLSITASCVAAGAPMELVGLIGNVAGSMHAQTLCNKNEIKRERLLRRLKEVWRC